MQQPVGARDGGIWIRFSGLTRKHGRNGKERAEGERRDSRFGQEEKEGKGRGVWN